MIKPVETGQCSGQILLMTNPDWGLALGGKVNLSRLVLSVVIMFQHCWNIYITSSQHCADGPGSELELYFWLS